MSRKFSPLQIALFAFGGLVALSILLYLWGTASRSPQQTAIADCVAKLNNGTLSGEQLNRTCQLMCVRGQLDGCKSP
jgi:hypothetical protein